MKKRKREYATRRARLFPSTYERISKLADERRTSMAQIIDERFPKDNS